MDAAVTKVSDEWNIRPRYKIRKDAYFIPLDRQPVQNVLHDKINSLFLGDFYLPNWAEGHKKRVPGENHH
jgi:hypothetical protein